MSLVMILGLVGDRTQSRDPTPHVGQDGGEGEWAGYRYDSCLWDAWTPAAPLGGWLAFQNTLTSLQLLNLG